MKKGLIIAGVSAILGIGGSALYANRDNVTQTKNGESANVVEQVEGSTSDAPSGSQDGVDYDCPDFATHQEAQDYFESQGGSPSNNVDRLDSDRDRKSTR